MHKIAYEISKNKIGERSIPRTKVVKTKEKKSKVGKTKRQERGKR